MVLTTSFNETIKRNLQASVEFRCALLKEAVGCMIEGDFDTGISVLGKYIDGTVGFIKLGKDLSRSSKMLMRMFSDKSNPRAKSLFEMIAYLQKIEGMKLEVVERAA